MASWDAPFGTPPWDPAFGGGLGSDRGAWDSIFGTGLMDPTLGNAALNVAETYHYRDGMGNMATLVYPDELFPKSPRFGELLDLIPDQYKALLTKLAQKTGISLESLVAFVANHWQNNPTGFTFFSTDPKALRDALLGASDINGDPVFGVDAFGNGIRELSANGSMHFKWNDDGTVTFHDDSVSPVEPGVTTDSGNAIYNFPRAILHILRDLFGVDVGAPGPLPMDGSPKRGY